MIKTIALISYIIIFIQSFSGSNYIKFFQRIVLYLDRGLSTDMCTHASTVPHFGSKIIKTYFVQLKQIIKIIETGRKNTHKKHSDKTTCNQNTTTTPCKTTLEMYNKLHGSNITLS